MDNRLLFEMLRDSNALALLKIKTVLEDDALDDFMCIEKIVQIIEEMGGTCGNRHDFG